MNRKGILGLAVALAMVVIAAYIVRIVWLALTSMPIELASALAAAIGGLAGIIYQKMMDRRNEIRARQRDKKAAVYERFFDLWLLRAQPSPSENGVDREFVKMSGDMMLWGADKVLSQWALFVRHLQRSHGQMTEETIKHFADLILLIREDLEHSNRKCTDDDIYTILGKESGAWPFWPLIESDAASEAEGGKTLHSNGAAVNGETLVTNSEIANPSHYKDRPSLSQPKSRRSRRSR